jgi:hypothetical protein
MITDTGKTTHYRMGSMDLILRKVFNQTRVIGKMPKSRDKAYGATRGLRQMKIKHGRAL